MEQRLVGHCDALSHGRPLVAQNDTAHIQFACQIVNKLERINKSRCDNETNSVYSFDLDHIYGQSMGNGQVRRSHDMASVNK